ncbi:MAG: hypothetical protein HRT90_02300 [Candidatus Margulisbacteria bacterium]|nr:hypothetical protein [Candidatus Margulisiibacteriota bacterium]
MMGFLSKSIENIFKLKEKQRDFSNVKSVNDTFSNKVIIALSGFFWMLTYVFIIYVGFRDKTYGMPLVALCANISWEFIFSYVYPHRKPQLYINKVWFWFDIIILGQFLYYGPKNVFWAELSPMLFYLNFIGILIISFIVLFYINERLSDHRHGKYTAFGQNLLMSILFVYMFYLREPGLGQSIYIAICKMMGTLFASIVFFKVLPEKKCLNILYIAILLFDCFYLALLM